MRAQVVFWEGINKDAQSNNRKPKDSEDDEAIAHENYFNPESGFAASESTTGQSP